MTFLEKINPFKITKQAFKQLNLTPGDNVVRETLEELMEEGDHQVDSDSHERTLLRNVLDLRDITAWDVMVPRADITAIDIKTPIPELVSEMVKMAHSRLPVYRNTLDDVVGMVHIKDVLAQLNSAKKMVLSDLVRKVLFVSPSIRALDLLQEMRMTRLHLALVVDEFGGIDGLITIEDLVEEIVGEIIDEHDVEEGPKIINQSDGTAVANARATVEELEELFGPVLNAEEKEEAETLAGLIYSITGRIAKRGEIIRHGTGLEFEVLEADPRRLKTVRVRLPTKTPTPKTP
ncbi:MAG: hemolysin family protein [Alphaproteobacteria bacterium]|nr:hemolysin family protein [Alphaproteobacteria bacterium]MDG1885678.1 hemolysin family protein [Alphaproteobacteria bacterium]